jgi:hypothetical protein
MNHWYIKIEGGSTCIMCYSFYVLVITGACTLRRSWNLTSGLYLTLTGRECIMVRGEDYDDTERNQN